MHKQVIVTALRMLVVMTILTGIVYPLSVTGIAQIFLADKANGSLVTRDGQVVGSELIGQQIDDPRYFWWRPSAVEYMQGNNPDSSGATNFSWTNIILANEVAQRAADFRKENGLSDDVPVPAEMLFASGSGLDPHISPETARLQLDRVATARGLDRQQVANLVQQFIESPQLGFLGQPRVNALLLNLALDELE